mmetsp:Transcript_91444/g.217911  ORF Transcript_91444/g.217911 Transcript_91444/m.217911 type:complete len:96 (+) Transcript_91444:507-794(+)
MVLESHRRLSLGGTCPKALQPTERSYCCCFRLASQRLRPLVGVPSLPQHCRDGHVGGPASCFDLPWRGWLSYRVVALMVVVLALEPFCDCGGFAE